VLDFCDTHVPTVIHPTAPLAPSLFALGELRRVSGRDLILDFVLGAEMPDRASDVAEPLPAGLAHHRDLRGVRRRHRECQTSCASGRANGLRPWPWPCRDPGRGPLRMPRHAGQKRSRRQRGAQRSLVGFIGRARPCRPGRAAHRQPRLFPRACREPATFGSHRRTRRGLGNHEDRFQALSVRLRCSSGARLRHRLAARASQRDRGKGEGHRQSASGRAHRPAEHFQRAGNRK
jgi:hypothetical protein